MRASSKKMQVVCNCLCKTHVQNMRSGYCTWVPSPAPVPNYHPCELYGVASSALSQLSEWEKTIGCP